MTNILESYSMDFTSRIQHAQREDGQWFRRIQYRDPRYGYKWSKWQPTSSAPTTASQVQATVRLPKSA